MVQPCTTLPSTSFAWDPMDVVVGSSVDDADRTCCGNDSGCQCAGDLHVKCPPESSDSRHPPDGNGHYQAKLAGCALLVDHLCAGPESHPERTGGGRNVVAASSVAGTPACPRRPGRGRRSLPRCWRRPLQGAGVSCLALRHPVPTSNTCSSRPAPAQLRSRSNLRGQFKAGNY
jgi:hypothetical protein